MALRVLLADESTTIKKVLQLALQDFAVEVKAVHSGLDVLEVARAFQPDVVFADVLLAKRNGYDVAGDLKKDAQLKAIPVVLMWSSFMDLDEKAYLNAKANGKLEKPFDVENLRQLILELVPKTQTQRLAHFLRFPAAFADPLESEEAMKKQTAAAAPSPQIDPGGSIHAPDIPSITLPPVPTDPLAGLPLLTKAKKPALAIEAPMNPDPEEDSVSGWNIDSFEDLKHLTDQTLGQAQTAAGGDEDDEPVRITKLGGGKAASEPRSITAAPPPSQEAKAEEGAGDPWAHQDLARFKLDIPEGDIDKNEISIVFDMDEVEVPKNDDFLLNAQKNESTSSGLTRTSATRTSARIKLPNLGGNDSATSTQIRPQRSSTVTQKARPEDTLPNPPLEGVEEAAGLELEAAPGPTPPLDPRDRYVPVAQIRHADGEMINQFDPVEQESPILELDDVGPATQAFDRTSIAGHNPQLSLDQLESIVRAQSQDIIEALVRKIVPDLAAKIIKEELERLVKNGDAG